MCRFLMFKSKKAVKPDRLLSDFAKMCKNNSVWQGDGFGVAWMLDDRSWMLDKSLKPVWEDGEKFKKIPATRLLVVHARGASFSHQRGNIDFNQPYIDDSICFVFNGELYGVKLNAEGKIGAQKIFNLLKRTSLERVGNLLRKNSKKILGMNIGFIKGDSINVRCDYDEQKDYYTLRYYISDDLVMICSEQIGNYKWKSMKKGEIKEI